MFIIFARKMPGLYMTIAREIFFPDFFWAGRGHVHLPPCSRLLRLFEFETDVHAQPLKFEFTQNC